MCTVCGEWEAGTFVGSTEFCSVACIDASLSDEQRAQVYDATGDGWGHDDIMAMYDDDPNPYAGTYSED
jgi:hypothetical protein